MRRTTLELQMVANILKVSVESPDWEVYFTYSSKFNIQTWGFEFFPNQEDTKSEGTRLLRERCRTDVIS